MRVKLALYMALSSFIMLNAKNVAYARDISLPAVEEKILIQIRKCNSFQGKIQTGNSLQMTVKAAQQGRLTTIIYRYIGEKDSGKDYAPWPSRRGEIASFLARAIALTDKYKLNSLPLVDVENRYKLYLRNEMILPFFNLDEKGYFRKGPDYFLAILKDLRGRKLVEMIYWFTYTRYMTRYSVEHNPGFKEAFRQTSGDCSEFALVHLYFLKKRGMASRILAIQTGPNPRRDIHLMVVTRSGNVHYLLDQYGVSMVSPGQSLRQVITRHLPVRRVRRIVELDGKMFLDRGVLFIVGPLR